MEILSLIINETIIRSYPLKNYLGAAPPQIAKTS